MEQLFVDILNSPYAAFIIGFFFGFSLPRLIYRGWGD